MKVKRRRGVTRPLYAAAAAAPAPPPALRPPLRLPGAFQCFGELIQTCWDTDPSARPNMDHVVEETSKCLARCQSFVLHQEQVDATKSMAAAAAIINAM